MPNHFSRLLRHVRLLPRPANKSYGASAFWSTHKQNEIAGAGIMITGIRSESVRARARKGCRGTVLGRERGREKGEGEGRKETQSELIRLDHAVSHRTRTQTQSNSPIHARIECKLRYALFRAESAWGKWMRHC